MDRNSKIILILIIVFFLVTRFWGLGQFYHQDEYRWISIVNTAEFGELESPHPPIMEILLSAGAKLVGYNNLRMVPFIFSILNLLLIYILSLKLTGNKKVGLLAAGLYSVNIYSLIASLMIDIDGVILPFFVLLTYYFYLGWVKNGNKKLLLGLVMAIVGGFLTKLSFTLFVGALIVEYLLVVYKKGELGYSIKKLFYLFGSLIGSAAVLYVFYGSSHPWFIEYTISRFQSFSNQSKSYFDLFLRLFKFFIWFSPLLFLPMVYGLFKKDIFKKYRIWYVYSLFNFLFYLVIFDFTTLPIERYFMFIIAPAVLISAEVIYSFINKFNKKHLVFGLLGFLVLLIFTLSINYDIIPLNPKEAYIERIKNLDFNFLISLTGGSGPIGFYGSAQFILWSWLISIVILLYCYIVKKPKEIFIAMFVVFGVGYNVLFSFENLTGYFYGSVDNIIKKSVDYVINNPEIEGVITYYDAGVYYLKLADKYDSRFYTAPKRDYSQKLTYYRGHYMIVDFPAVDKKSQYWKLISRCDLDKKFTDKYVDSYIFDCLALPPSSI